mmetsp:Transcript_13617/g.17740  ORF Transcript_13617/g.17740 Transcript_13617/m.17740 type:complete len:365 (-) Transcript_13617:108-1202(-)
MSLLWRAHALRRVSSAVSGSCSGSCSVVSVNKNLFSTSTTTTTTTTPETPSVVPTGPLLGKISVIGAGMMSQAMVEPMIQSGLQPADQLCVYDVSDTAMLQMHDKLGINYAQSIQECLSETDLVILAVKPQNLTEPFFQHLRDSRNLDGARANAIMLSVIAGTPLNSLARGGFDKVVRSMPNTPATIGQGMTVWSCTQNLTADERSTARKVLSSFGKSMYVDDEAFIDMSTSISGSGPAYIFMLMEAMIDAGVHMGFPRNQATTLVYHTMLGSTLYAMDAKEHPAILRNRVTSPSGTTASAIYELENGKFRTVIKDAMWACYRRSLEMGNNDPNVGPYRNQHSSNHNNAPGGSGSNTGNGTNGN